MEKKPTDKDFLYFKDDGVIPNSKYPLTIYRSSFEKEGDDGAEWLEKKFSSNGWSNSWRWGIYPFHHYHSNTHEVLGVYSGSADVKFGGEEGENVRLNIGDVVIIPAGVAHKCITHSDDFKVVGAYPEGREPDMKKGDKADRPAADDNIQAVPFPASDPLMGDEGLVQTWKYEKEPVNFILPGSTTSDE